MGVAVLLAAACGKESLPRAEAVDMGTSVLWASFDIGCAAEYERGAAFCWGDAHPCEYVHFNWTVCPHCTVDKEGNLIEINKYNQEDGLLKLRSDDDGAENTWNSGWRMPTKAEFEELLDKKKFTWEWVEEYQYEDSKGSTVIPRWNIGGNPTVSGLRVTNNTTNATLFFPAGGRCVGTGIRDAGRHGYFWTSMRADNDPREAIAFHIYRERETEKIGGQTVAVWKDYHELTSVERFSGIVIRPVREK